MEENNLNLKELDYIAVTIGPGSYTSIRVGLSISQGIAYSLSIPIVPVNTMDYLHSKSIYLEDKDKIFSNLNGTESPNLSAAMVRGDWDGVNKVLQQSRESIIEEIKNSI